jgi:Disulphide bond corrector protein DsbC
MILYQLTVLLILVHSLTGDSESTSNEIVKITAPEVMVPAGKSSVIRVKIEVKKGYHIQANKVNNEFLIPTTLEINTDRKIILGKKVFPRSKKFKLEGTDNFLDVYDGIFEISIPFETCKTIQKRDYVLGSKFTYQACDSKSCLFPKIIDFFIHVKVLPQEKVQSSNLIQSKSKML